MTYFSGRVHTIIWDNPSQGFYILKMALDGQPDELPTVRGNVLGIAIQIGTWFGFEGDWVIHEQYGRQITIQKAPVIKAWDVDAAASILVANGVGEKIVAALRGHFKEGLPDVLERGDATALGAVKGLTPIAAEHVVSRWRVAKAYFRTLEFLSDAGVPRNRVSQVWAMFGDEAETVLSTNPWALVRLDGVTFTQADEVALRLGLDMTNPYRVEGAVRFVCRARKGMGHLYLTSGEILGEVQALIPGTTSQAVAMSIAALHKVGSLVVDRQTRPGVVAIYEAWLHKVEVESAKLLRERMVMARLEHDLTFFSRYVIAVSHMGSESEKAIQKTPGDVRAVVEAAMQDWSSGSHIALSEAQRRGVINALTEPVSVITGLPGTGKSTAMRAVVSILKDAEVEFLLVAPTGIAAKRIATLTGAPAATIHRAFGAKGASSDGRQATYVGVTGQSSHVEEGDSTTEYWTGAEHPHSADVIIVDECSMVDQHLLFRLLTCTKPTARLVLIGDAAQLPSVGPGNVLRDIVSSNLFPIVNLTEIFRQADTSQIIVAAHAINRGKTPEAKSEPGAEFMLISSKDEDKVLDIVVKAAVRLYDKRENFQVMSPRHAGTVGVTNLNARLRELLNPKQKGLQEMRIGSEVIREEDRVMVVKNNYELEIFNGDVGKVSRLDRKEKMVEVKIHGPPVQYVKIPFKDAGENLRLAYAVTVHKSQGLEYDTVVLPLVLGFSHQLQRNLFYTAITRARRRVILVGQYEAMVRAINNNRPDSRNTLFLDRLRTVFGKPVAVLIDSQPLASA